MGRTSKFAAALAVALTAGVIAGCAGTSAADPDAGSAATPTSGGVAHVAALAEMPGFDPTKVANIGTGLERAIQVMDTLLYRDEETDEVSPRLAEGIESEDGQTWVLTLREGVTFTDGTPLDADAVVFNIERHLAPESTSTAKALLSGVRDVTATAEYEVTFALDEPSGSFPLALTGSSPASLIGSPAALADPDSFNSHPVGAGPFMFESWTRDDKLTLVKNDDYWDTGKPYLDGVEYTIMTDPQTRADDLRAGGTDLALLVSTGIAQADGVDTIEVFPGRLGGQAVIPNGATGPGSDPRVREAIALAFDPATTAAVVFGGGGQYWDGDTSCIPFPVGSPACDPSLGTAQDLDRARELVAEYAAGGGPVALDLVYLSSTVNLVTYYQQQLTDIGLDVTMRGVDLAGLTEAQATGDYGVLSTATASAGYPTVWNRLYSGGTNWGKVTYPDLDEALLRARDELSLEDRNAAWQDVQRANAENHVVTWVSTPAQAMARATRLHIDSGGDAYSGSTLVYFSSAWIDR